MGFSGLNTTYKFKLSIVGLVPVLELELIAYFITLVSVILTTLSEDIVAVISTSEPTLEAYCKEVLKLPSEKVPMEPDLILAMAVEGDDDNAI